jgi:gluconolactonase
MHMVATLTFVVVASGLKFPEGPAWGPDGKLYFSSCNTPATLRVDDPATQKWSVVREGGGNGLAFDPKGRLVICDHVRKLVSRMEKDGTITVLAELYSGIHLTQPNDLVIDEKGTVYFTDPDFAAKKGAVYRLTEDGTLTQLDNQIQATNGIALRDGGKVLLVAATTEKCVYELTLADDGKVTGKRKFVDLNGEGEVGPDGMSIDEKGMLYVAVFGGGRVVVVDPDGKIVQRIDTDGKNPTNCCFGGKDGKTLFVTETEKNRVLAYSLDVAGQKEPVSLKAVK